MHELLEQIEIEASNLASSWRCSAVPGSCSSAATGHEVVYSVSVPEVRDLLLAARRILRGLLEDRDQLKRELRPAPWPAMPRAAAPALA